MGLDSVELVVEIEKYFRIQIPDAEAEKIYTVMDMTNTVAKHLNIESNETPLRDIIFSSVRSGILTIDKTTKEMLLTDKVSNYLPIGEKAKWTELENHIQLKLPIPDQYNPNGTSLRDKFKRLINWAPNYDWQTISFEHFIDTICANNYLTVLQPGKIKTKHEIYIGVMGITVDKIGVDFFEVLPEKFFTSDLGVD